MWLFSTVGFFSVVQKPGDEDLTVRTRVKGDLEALREQFLPTLGATTATPRADYPYRAKVSHEVLGKALGKIAEATTYDNFKNRIAKTAGPGRAHLYSDVWSVMYDCERKLN